MSHKPRGFTLIEMLVVITVVAVLISMLVPSLSQARKTAQVIRCGSNLRQTGVMLNSYQADCQGYYPAFGGLAAWDGTHTQFSNAYGGGPYAWALWMSGTADATHLGFGKYLDSFYSNYSTGSQNSGLGLCPVQNWREQMVYSPGHPNHLPFDMNYSTGAAGPTYAFYCGRKSFINGLGNDYNYDTTQRRDDPTEILMSDMTLENEYWGNTNTTYTGNGYTTSLSNAYPYFNPHSGRSCTALPDGTAYVLTSNGAVSSYRFVDATLAQTYGNPYIGTMIKYTRAGPSSSLSNGPYWAFR